MLVSSKSCKFRANRWFFVIFYEMSHFFHLFAEKFTKTLKHGTFIEKLQALSKSMIFRAFWRNEPLFATFCWKVHQKGRNMVVSSKSCNSRPNRWFFVIFHEMSHFLQLFAEKLTKTQKHGCFLQKLQVLAKWMIFQQTVSHFLKKHEKSSIWPKLTTSRANYHAWAFWWAFQQKVAKSGSFLE